MWFKLLESGPRQFTFVICKHNFGKSFLMIINSMCIHQSSRHIYIETLHKVHVAEINISLGDSVWPDPIDGTGHQAINTFIPSVLSKEEVSIFLWRDNLVCLILLVPLVFICERKDLVPSTKKKAPVPSVANWIPFKSGETKTETASSPGSISTAKQETGGGRYKTDEPRWAKSYGCGMSYGLNGSPKSSCCKLNSYYLSASGQRSNKIAGSRELRLHDGNQCLMQNNGRCRRISCLSGIHTLSCPSLSQSDEIQHEDPHQYSPLDLGLLCKLSNPRSFVTAAQMDWGRCLGHSDVSLMQ